MTTPSSNATLTDEELRIKVAELRGWTQSHQQPPDFETDIRMWEKDGKYRYTHNLPPLTLDEIHEAEKMLSREKREGKLSQEDNYYCLLSDWAEDREQSGDCSWHLAISSTARQRAEAFVAVMENS